MITKLQQLIKKHKFDWANSDITEEHFPDDGRRLKDYNLFYFNKNISSEDVIEEMEKGGYQPATVYELLEWKDWNDKDWIVALGSKWRDPHGRLRVACLSTYGSERRLSLLWFDFAWYDYCRFLAVRKSLRPLDSKTLKPFDLLKLEIKYGNKKYKLTEI